MKTNKILSRIIKDIMKCIKKNQCSVSPHTHRFYIVDIILNMSGYGNLGQLTSFLDYVIIFFLELNMNEKVFGEKEKASKRNIDRKWCSKWMPRTVQLVNSPCVGRAVSVTRATNVGQCPVPQCNLIMSYVLFLYTKYKFFLFFLLHLILFSNNWYYSDILPPNFSC